MLLVILLIGHMVADYFLQSSNMAENKKNHINVLLAHSGIYFLTFIIIDFLFFQPWFAVWTTLIISVTHFFIDLIRTKIDNKFKDYRVRFLAFLFDQVLHTSIIVATYYLLNLSTKVNSIYSACKGFPNFDKILLYCLLFVILLDPTAVFIKKLFAFIFKNEELNNNLGNNAGSIIGKLERIITAILLLGNQYSVIGLVLTAKSIARFKQLEDKDFAEKYLIGTLLSLSISLILTLLIKYILTL